IQRAKVALAYRQCTEVPGTGTAGQLHARIDVDGITGAAQADTPRVKGNAIDVVVEATPAATGAPAKAEDVDVLQEEVALLRKKQREAREVHLAVVHFGGREVRVEGQGAGEVRRDLVEHVQRRVIAL